MVPALDLASAPAYREGAMRLRPNADEPILSAAGQGEPGLPATCFAPAAWVYSDWTWARFNVPLN
jgi:hypothetical protein